MTKRLVFFYLCAFCCCSLSLRAQNMGKVSFSGTVLAAANDEPIPAAVIYLVEPGLWTTTDKNGQFHLKGIPQGTVSVHISCLGMEEGKYTITLNRNIENFTIRLKETTLGLDEVVVTAQSGGKNHTSSLINRAAIDHVQAASLSDLMKLLPGVFSSNPNLNKINQITIRDLPSITNGTQNPTASNAIGVSIVLDGANLSNDMNMQTRSTSSSGFETAAEKGIDARQIATNSIESMEVIRGVASAEYGDLNSGSVLVKTKAGKSPYEVRFSTNPNLKLLTAGKGFDLQNDRGVMNLDLEYAYSNKDNRTPTTTFNRLTAGWRYSNTFNKEGAPFRLNAHLRGYLTQNKEHEDPDADNKLLYKSNASEISLNVHGTWALSKSWITSLRYVLAGTLGNQYNYEQREISASAMSATTSTMESGINPASFLPAKYRSVYKVEGRPFRTQVKLIATLSDRYGEIGNNLMIGAEWSMKGNNGEGKRYETYQPASGVRPNRFKDIPFIHEYAFFAEDKVTLPLGKQRLEITPGIRLTNINTDAVDYDLIVDPRLNIRWTLTDKRHAPKGLKHLSLRGSWGIQHKMPTLYYLYPDTRYSDKLMFSYVQDNYQFGVFNTRVIDCSNPHLKTPQSTIFGVGADITLHGVKISLDYYDEKQRNAFNTERIVTPFSYTKFSDLTEVTSHIEYKDGQIHYNDKVLAGAERTDFISYDRPSNGSRNDKWGIEYVFDFGRIDALRTSLIMDGAYMYQRFHDESLQMAEKSYGTTNIIGIYPGTTNGAANGRIAERLNTTFRIVTHIPALRFVVSLDAQCVWIDNNQRTFSYKGKNLVYMKNAAGEIVPGDPGKNSTDIKCLNPVMYMDINGLTHEFTMEDALLPEFSNVPLVSANKFFLKDKLGSYFQLDLRLTKEIGKLATLAFYANNLASANPKKHYQSTNQYQKMNSEISFGAELKFKF